MTKATPRKNQRFLYYDGEIKFSATVISVDGNNLEYKQDAKEYKDDDYDTILWRTTEYLPNGRAIDPAKTEYNKHITYGGNGIESGVG